MDVLYLCVLVVAMHGVQTVAASGKCTYGREYKMMGANCFSQDFEEVPKTLNRDIEYLYAVKNRIRGLTNSSLREYTSLRLLYLGDNFITKIEGGAFSELSELEVLDLSKNAFTSLPTDLPLPLRKLYLSLNRDLKNLTLSAAFNLNFLALADCDLKQIPALGVLPNLKELNITENPLENVTPADLAPLCRLERLYLPQTLYKQPGSQCQCHRLLTWTSQHYISLPSFNCTSLDDPEAAACDMDLSEEIKTYKACLVAVPASTTRMLLVAVLVGTLLLAAIVVICWWRKGRRKKNSVQDQKTRHQEKSTKAADTLIT